MGFPHPQGPAIVAVGLNKHQIEKIQRALNYYSQQFVPTTEESAECDQLYDMFTDAHENADGQFTGTKLTIPYHDFTA